MLTLNKPSVIEYIYLNIIIYFSVPTSISKTASAYLQAKPQCAKLTILTKIKRMLSQESLLRNRSANPPGQMHNVAFQKSVLKFIDHL